MNIAQRLAPAGTRRRRAASKLAKIVGLRRKRRVKATDETAKLQRSWAKHDPDSLDAYLVSGYQNPRINAQSILTRHALVSELFGDQFDRLMQNELQFCTEAVEAIRQRATELRVEMGAYLDSERRADVDMASSVISHWEATYEELWRQTLEGRAAEPLTVLEFACGSANDYRFFESYGIADYLDYRGVDLNETNIGNARRRHPEVRFEVGSILDLPFEDQSFDYIIASDIFEHLSIPAMEKAMSEACRLARKGIVINFFSMEKIPEHKVRRRGSYHWNVLSAKAVKNLLEPQFNSKMIEVHEFLAKRFRYEDWYTKKAWTLLAERRR